MLHVHQFPSPPDDNYGLLLHDDASGETVVIDTPDAALILETAAQKGWRISQIWNTHWHQDHAGGNAAIKAQTGAFVTGPREVERLGQAPDRIVDEGDSVKIGAHTARVLNVGGHTLGHIAYILDADRIGFVGDSLFSLGCGRMFEGTAEQFWTSLSKYRALPDDLTLYCAHEYTAGNARYAVHVDPDNEVLQQRAAEVVALRAVGKPTLPMNLGAEKRANPFLRAPELKEKLGLAGRPDHEVFLALREGKNNFKG
jgi:hydroxyacylglutathione hydrolase